MFYNYFPPTVIPLVCPLFNVNMSVLPAFPTNAFYGESKTSQTPCREKSKKLRNSVIPYSPKNLLSGPNILWKVFQKQHEALEFLKCCKDGLMCFAFEHFGSGRLFLVAHPEVFWHYDIQRDADSRCTYEIITEFTVCKVYVDLEYDISLNRNSNGSKMVDIFINLVCFYLNQIWGVVCTKKDVLNLDSTTNSKFSRHLIFNLQAVCFINNYQVGFFIKYLCQNIRGIVESGTIPDSINQFTIVDFKSLNVIDAKGNKRLFCDEGVYTRNRHFRLYGSTKKGKHSNLTVSEENEFAAANNLQMFLHSLVTYVNIMDVKVLEFSNAIIEKKKLPRAISLKNEVVSSPYPFVDKFISDLVLPGKIYRSVYFAAKKVIVYDIVGNRYCGNIKRTHKSNNVKYVVDLIQYLYYQKCHDYDCAGYRSDKLPLPCEIIFKITDNSDICVGDDNNRGMFGLSGTNTEQVLDAIQAVETSCDRDQPDGEFKRFPSFGLSDEEFVQINC